MLYYNQKITKGKYERKIKMKYNQYPLNHIKKLIAKGQEATTEFDNIDSFLYNIDCDFDEVEFLGLGFKNPDFDVW